MMRFTRKKLVAIAAGTLTLGLGVGAYAYFTAPGSGTGTASVGTSSNIELSATTASTLWPSTSTDVTITVHNPGSGAQHVDTVKLDSVDTGALGCAGSDFTMPDVAVNTTLAADGSVIKHGTLTMANATSSQNPCKGASLTLNLSSN
jgi:hypothetical protein